MFMLILVYLTMSNTWLDQINMTTWTLHVLGVLGIIFQTFHFLTSTTMDQLVKKQASGAVGTGFKSSPLPFCEFLDFLQIFT
jgi:hypothetical protein